MSSLSDTKKRGILLLLNTQGKNYEFTEPNSALLVTQNLAPSEYSIYLDSKRLVLPLIYPQQQTRNINEQGDMDSEPGYVYSAAPDPRRLDPQENPRYEETGCFAITQEKKYYGFTEPNGSVFVKRNLTPSEYSIHLRSKELIIPFMCPERLRNEIATIKYIQKETTIPTPNIRCSFEDHGRVYIITDTVPGVPMSELRDDQKAVVPEELEGYIEQMHALKSNKMGGLGGDIVLPYRFEKVWPRDQALKFRDADTPEFVLCHNDLSMYNVIVDEETLKINAILDWEYAGYFPPEFDRAFYLRPGGAVALEGEEDDVSRLLKVLEHWRA